MGYLNDLPEVREVDAKLAALDQEEADQRAAMAAVEHEYAARMATWQVERQEVIRAGRMPKPAPEAPFSQAERLQCAADMEQRRTALRAERDAVIVRLSGQIESDVAGGVEALADGARALVERLDGIAGEMNSLRRDLFNARMVKYAADVSTGKGAARPSQPVPLTAASLADCIAHDRPLTSPQPQAFGFIRGPFVSKELPAR